MTLPPQLIRRLRNIPVGVLIRSLERDGFTYRHRRGAAQVYRHSDGRKVGIHYHHSRDTLPVDTLREILRATRWTADDLRRLDLI